MINANIALRVKKPNLELSTNNLNLAKEGYTMFLPSDLVKKSFSKFLDLVVLTSNFAQLTLLLLPVLSMILSFLTDIGFLTKGSTPINLCIEVSGANF